MKTKKIKLNITENHKQAGIAAHSNGSSLALCCALHQALRPLLTIDSFMVGIERVVDINLCNIGFYSCDLKDQILGEIDNFKIGEYEIVVDENYLR